MAIVSSQKIKALPADCSRLFAMLPINIRQMVERVPGGTLDKLEEIRLRRDRPLALGLEAGEYFLKQDGELGLNPDGAYRVSGEDIERIARLISNSSIYALEEELRNGYITVSGGHRIGIAGKAVVEGGRVKTIKYFSGFNIRISRDIKGIGLSLLPRLLGREKQLKNTLIVSPPKCGKTTLLRDLVRLTSNGVPELEYPGTTVGLVDERSELAGCFKGIPQRDVGLRTDVLDGCPKAEGMMILLRAMAPQVLATDEIGRQEDISSLEEVFNAGVTVLTTVHGSSPEELRSRPALRYLLGLGVIEKFVILGRSRGPGTVEAVIDGKSSLIGGEQR